MPLPDAVAALESGDDFGHPMDSRLAGELADSPIRRGVLTEIEVDGDLHCGPPAIPSLSQHLTDRNAPEL